MTRPALALAMLLATLLGWVPPCQAAPAPGTDTPYVLEICVNGHPHRGIAVVLMRGSSLFMQADDLAAAGIAVTPEEVAAAAGGLLALDKLPGLSAHMIAEQQTLDLTVSEARMTPQVFDLRAPGLAAPGEAATGFLGHYDLSVTTHDLEHPDTTSGGAGLIGGTYFTPYGNLTAMGFADADTNASRVMRLDTTAEIDEPDKTRRWLVGDAVTGGPSWARPVRFGGLQFSTDFSLRPDLATFPLPAFFGQSAVPATVDVFVNSARVFETGIEPGPFQVNNLPVITGGGEASVVVRDVLGRETVTVLPFFASSALLKKDLDAYDASLGFIRRSYGETSFDYGDPAASGSYSRGITNWLTLESHAEATPDIQLAGAGVTLALSPFGTVHLASAASLDSRDEDKTGTLNAISFESQLSPFGFFGSATATQGAYADIATIGGAAPPKLQLQLGSNVNLGRWGALAGSWIDTQQHGQAASRLFTSSYTVPVGRDCSLIATGFYDQGTQRFIGEATLTIFLGDGYNGSAAIRAGRQMNEQRASFSKTANPDGGFGYSVTAAHGDDDLKEADATWINTSSRIDAALSNRQGLNAARLDLSGGMVAMDDRVYATQTPNGAVALVKTGAPGATVYRENRPVAVADSDGEALVTGLTPFVPNRITIDPQDYALTTLLDATEKTVVPGRASGVRVDFTPTPRAPVLVVLKMKDDSFPPAGARVVLDSGADPLVVGHHGEVFIADLQKETTGRVAYDSGACRFQVAPKTAAADEGIPRLGPLLCEAETL